MQMFEIILYILNDYNFGKMYCLRNMNILQNTYKKIPTRQISVILDTPPKIGQNYMDINGPKVWLRV